MRVEDEDGSVHLFGYPSLIRTVNQILASELFALLTPLLRVPTALADRPFSLVLVDNTGKRCSRCLIGERCRGCVRLLAPDSQAMVEEEETLLQAGDNIAITFSADAGMGKELLESLTQVV